MVSTPLFGLNIAQLVDQGLQSAGGVRSGVLTRSTPGTRTPGSLTGGTNPTTATFPFRGFIENKTDEFRDGTLVRDGGQFLSILGNSISTAPQAGDTVALDGNAFTIVGVPTTDPAQALFVCRVES